MAGLMIGLVTSIKPFLAPLGLFLVFRRQWWAAFVSAASLIAAYGFGLAVFGSRLTETGSLPWGTSGGRVR